MRSTFLGRGSGCRNVGRLKTRCNLQGSFAGYCFFLKLPAAKNQNPDLAFLHNFENGNSLHHFRQHEHFAMCKKLPREKYYRGRQKRDRTAAASRGNTIVLILTTHTFECRCPCAPYRVPHSRFATVQEGERRRNEPVG